MTIESSTMNMFTDLLSQDFTTQCKEKLKEAGKIMISNKYDIHSSWIGPMVTFWYISKVTKDIGIMIVKVEDNMKKKTGGMILKELEKLKVIKKLSGAFKLALLNNGVKESTIESPDLDSLLKEMASIQMYKVSFSS